MVNNLSIKIFFKFIKADIKIWPGLGRLEAICIKIFELAGNITGQAE